MLSSTAPGDNGVGAIILRDLCRMVPKEALCAFLLTPPAASNTLGEEFSWLPTKVGRECSWKLNGSRLRRLLNWPTNAWRNLRQVRRLVAEAASFARSHQVELVWAVLDSPTSIAIARRVAKELCVPFVVMIWDDIHHNLPYFGVYRLSQRFLLREWERTLRQASRCAVIGETMKEEYDRDFGTDTIILRHGVDSDLIPRLATVSSSEGPVQIGFVGSVAARSAFSAFVRALDSCDWRLGGRAVQLNLAGHRFDLWCQKPANINYLGWRSLDECIAMLRQSDFNYLPQPFETNLEPFCRLSFPTKLTTYLAAGRPALLHCPEIASLREFLRFYRFGIWTESFEPATLIGEMERLLFDKKLYAECVIECRNALEREFSRIRFRTAFESLLGFQL